MSPNAALAHDVRLAARTGRLTAPTGSMASGMVQANLALIPAALADDFQRFLRANPGPFPLLARGRAGDPAVIGVDLSCPIDGIGLTDIRPGDVPVFWACGVSLERAIARAAPDLPITHAPGHMLVTDLPATALPHLIHPA